MFNKFTRRAILGLLVVGAVPTLPQAAIYGNGSKSASFEVSLKVLADCSVTTADLDFGQTHGVLGSPINVNTTVNVTCTNTTPYNIGLNAGSVASSTTTTRYLAGTGANTALVQFALLQAAGGANWGNAQGTDTFAGTGSGSVQAITVYGVIPAQTSPLPDTYKSTITATVYF